jgi:hypothetical protein
VLDRLLMYERRIENSMIKMMDQLYRLRLIRELEESKAVEEDPGAPGDDLKKQSQSAPAQRGANSFTGERYENKPLPGLQENKVKQNQIYWNLPCPESCRLPKFTRTNSNLAGVLRQKTRNA